MAVIVLIDSADQGSNLHEIRPGADDQDPFLQIVQTVKIVEVVSETRGVHKFMS